MACLVLRGAAAAVVAVGFAAPVFGFELIAGPASPDTLEEVPPSLATAYAPTATQDYDSGGLFDEFRLGASAGLDGASDRSGVAIDAVVLLDPLVLRFESAFATDLLSPRPLLGVSLSPEGGSNQLFAGFAWDVQITDLFFVEASFAGGVNGGQLDVDEEDADRVLRCSVHLRQSAGLGMKFGDHLRLVTSLDHSSDAGLCGDSTGVTQAGAAFGYRF
jgi:hypothetical protein